MVYSLAYRRPGYVSNVSDGSINGEEKQRSLDESIQSSSTCSMCAGIPEALSFDRIVAGGTCPVSFFLITRHLTSSPTWHRCTCHIDGVGCRCLSFVLNRSNFTMLWFH